jgi:hypothetical protein
LQMTVLQYLPQTMQGMEIVSCLRPYCREFDLRNDDAGKTQRDGLYREEDEIPDESSIDVAQNGESLQGDVV